MKPLLRAPYSLAWLCGGPLWSLHTIVASLRIRGAINVIERTVRRMPQARPVIEVATGDGPIAVNADGHLIERLPSGWSELVSASLELTAPIALALVQGGHANATVIAELTQESPRVQVARLESPLWLYELLTDEGRRVRAALQAIAARSPAWSVPYPKTDIELLAFAMRATLQVT